MKFSIILAASLVLAGCARDSKIDGEIFTNLPAKGLVKQAGTVVYFLSATEKAELDKIVGPWRDGLYAKDRKSLEETATEYIALFDKHKKDDGKVHDSKVISQLEVMESTVIYTKSRIDEKDHDRRLPFEEPQAKAFFAGKKQSTADSEGRFAVILSIGKEYWVVASAALPKHEHWCFRYTPDGTKLVLSDGNAL